MNSQFPPGHKNGTGANYPQGGGSWVTCRRPRLPLEGPAFGRLATGAQRRWVTSIGSAATVRAIRGATPRAPLDASGGCLATGPQRLRSPEEVRVRFGSPQRRRTPMRDKNVRRANGEGKYPWGLVILVTNQGAPTRAGGEANYFKPARGVRN